MKLNTVKGTNDYLPAEVELRDYMITKIVETYKSYGFVKISTPILEDIDNLNKSEGGENLGLIFQVLKRGDKLASTIEEKCFDELADMGLRYDLTLPLTRYYSNNKSKLMLPFKCIQVDRVYRAERPQKGRLREFMQCDIDIIGMDSICAEIELIVATAEALLKLGIMDFTVRINDRRILKNILLSIGYQEEQLEAVSIAIDKFDKIGITGVIEELSERGFPSESNEQLTLILNKDSNPLKKLKREGSDNESINNLEEIINTIKKLASNRYNILFDPSLVRGQGYYTGTIFEIISPKYRGAIAGGGRYDNLIGKFLKENIPAVGFSIGFERIYNILSEINYIIPDKLQRIAVLYDMENFCYAMEQAVILRKDAEVTLYEKPRKLGKFLDKLKEQGFGYYLFADQENNIKIIEDRR